MPHDTDKPLSVSVVVPTAGKRSLAPCLASLHAQSTPPLEVIVVWNATCDPDAAADISKFRRLLPLRLVKEPVAGLNRARNAGCRAARGDIVALLDDDCAAGQQWVAALVDVFRRRPGAGIVCGAVTLDFEAPPPDWLVQPFLQDLSLLNWGEDETELGSQQYLVGANMAFTADMFRRIGGFDPSVGMAGTQPPQLANDEQSFVDAARQFGSPGVLYTPRAVVCHRIPVERATIDYLEHRRYGQGYSDARLTGDRADGWRHVMWTATEARKGFLWATKFRRRDLGEPAGRAFCENFLRRELAYLTGLVDAIVESPVEPLTPRIAPRAGEVAWPTILDGLKLNFLTRLDRMPSNHEQRLIASAIEGLNRYQDRRLGRPRAAYRLAPDRAGS